MWLGEDFINRERDFLIARRFLNDDWIMRVIKQKTDNENEYFYKLKVPGWSKDNISIELVSENKKNFLQIKGIKSESKFKESVLVDAEIFNLDDIKASCKDGLLVVRFKKLESKPARKITVE